MKYVIVLAIILFIYLLNYILKFKVGKDFKDLDSVSVISKAVIFSFIPIYSCQFLYVDWVILENNFFDTSKDSMLMNLAKQGAQFCQLLSILILFVFYYYSPWDTGLYIITMEIHIDTDYSLIKLLSE